MRKAEALWQAVDDRVEEVKRAQEASASGELALRILANPMVDGYVKRKFRELVEIMLTCPDDELVRWRANAAALIDHYTHLLAAVTQGEVAAKRLAEASPNSNKEE